MKPTEEPGSFQLDAMEVNKRSQQTLIVWRPQTAGRIPALLRLIAVAAAVGPIATIAAAGDVVEHGAVSGQAVQKRIQEAESALAVVEKEVIQERDDSGEGWTAATGAIDVGCGTRTLVAVEERPVDQEVVAVEGDIWVATVARIECPGGCEGCVARLNECCNSRTLVAWHRLEAAEASSSRDDSAREDAGDNLRGVGHGALKHSRTNGSHEGRAGGEVRGEHGNGLNKLERLERETMGSDGLDLTARAIGMELRITLQVLVDRETALRWLCRGEGIQDFKHERWVTNERIAAIHAHPHRELQTNDVAAAIRDGDGLTLAGGVSTVSNGTINR
jgi:hypothetical protein